MLVTCGDVHIYQALAVKHGLLFYARHGRVVNGAYTPSGMIQTARRITGLDLPARGYRIAAEALERWIEAQRAGQ